MSRIAETFKRLKREGRCGFIPFITAGDPSIDCTRSLLLALERAGADVIELGVPFSDPIADGPVIQRASQRALRNRISLGDILETVSDVRSVIDAPLIIFSYLNPLLQFGFKRFAIEAARAGVDGLLLTDLPLEESTDFAGQLQEKGLDLILLAAPTSTDQRLQAIAREASGFIYSVARTGVTGATDELSLEARALVTRLRKFTDLPIAVGFGISSASHFSEVARYADAAVVGSAIVAEIERNEGRPDLVQLIEAFVRSLSPAKNALRRKVNRVYLEEIN